MPTPSTEVLPIGPEHAARRTLARASRIAGSPEALARFLGLNPALLEGWLATSRGIPHRVFLAALEIVAVNGLTGSARRSLERRPDPAWHGLERRASSATH